MSRSVQHQRLASPGRNAVTLTVDADPFDITPAEREFLFGLVDALRGYNADHFGLPLPKEADKDG